MPIKREVQHDELHRTALSSHKCLLIQYGCHHTDYCFTVCQEKVFSAILKEVGLAAWKKAYS